MGTVKEEKALRIIFMGTPEFAVASLEAIVEDGWNVVAVITAPDKPAGRGMKMMSSAVKKSAEKFDIPVLQPEKLKDPSFIKELEGYKADLQIVVAFRMLPEVVWNMPPMGTVNVHASLLPDYRGAAPINWAIIRGENQTGITTFKLKQEIDTGNILMQKAVAIDEDETAGELHDKLKITGAELLIQTIHGLAKGTLTEIPQATYNPESQKIAPKLFTGSCLIDWNKSTEEIYNHIRGLSPYPAAFTYVGDKIMKIFSAEKEITDVIESPGTILSDSKNYIKFATLNGYIDCKEIQLAGKKRMKVEDFLRGNTIVV